jgi:hypothetical protein
VWTTESMPSRFSAIAPGRIETASVRRGGAFVARKFGPIPSNPEARGESGCSARGEEIGSDLDDKRF